MDLHNLPYRLKSARQKKRLVKKDRDKQLIKLDKLRSSLSKSRKSLPVIPLQHPYQKGWKKLFVLRENVQQSRHAGFYEEILKKINNVKYHYDKSFKVKKHRRKLYRYLEQPQKLSEIMEREWETNRLKLSDTEKLCFYPKEYWDDSRRCIVTRYAFIEPWRFVLAVKPHIIYEVKVHDQALEQEIQEVDDKVNSYYSWPRIQRLTNGRRRRHWSSNYFDKPKYINKLKNQPVYSNKEDYID